MGTQALVFLVGAIISLSGHGRGHAQSLTPARECHIKVVSFGFDGTPGTPVTYHGESYVINQTGHLELVAQKGDYTFEAAGQVMQVSNETPLDEFGSVNIDVDRAVAEAKTFAAAQTASLTIPSSAVQVASN